MRQNANTLALFLAHRSALVDYAASIVGNRSHAEDVVQEAWLRFERAARRERLDQPRRYLYRVVRNLALDGHRHTVRERRVFTGDGLEAVTWFAAEGEPSPEAAAVDRERLEIVFAAMAELPERTRIALEMHRIGGCKLREIAAFLGISISLAHELVLDGVEHCKHRLERS